MRDIFFWNTVSGNASLQSRDSEQRIPNLPENTGAGVNAPCPAVVADGSSNPASSYYGNYFAFESSYPLLDLDFEQTVIDHVEGLLPGAITSPVSKWAAAARLSHDAPTLHQVYLRYNGPKERGSDFPHSVWPQPSAAQRGTPPSPSSGVGQSEASSAGSTRSSSDRGSRGASAIGPIVSGCW